MPIFSSTSRHGRNQDGTYRIVCSDCKQYIADSQYRLGKVRCYICQASHEGRLLTAEQIEAYNASKMGERDVPMLNVSTVTEVAGEKFTLRSLGGFVTHALGFKKADVAPLESVKRSQQKARGRLFNGVDLEKPEGLGSMQEIDAQLNAAKERGQ